MRHAKAEPGIKDKVRPLSKEGWKELEKHSESNGHIFSHVQLILCSSSVRTQETLHGIRKCLPNRIIISYIDELYNASASTILREISLCEDKTCTILIIAHNPGVTDFVQARGEKSSLPIDKNMATSAIAEFSLAEKSWGLVEFEKLKLMKIYEV